jgi:hypothetical protein
VIDVAPVLNLAVGANDYVGVDVTVSANGGVEADYCGVSDVGEVPYLNTAT